VAVSFGQTAASKAKETNNKQQFKTSRGLSFTAASNKIGAFLVSPSTSFKGIESRDGTLLNDVV
jgi:hypothetical protein